MQKIKGLRVQENVVEYLNPKASALSLVGTKIPHENRKETGRVKTPL